MMQINENYHGEIGMISIQILLLIEVFQIRIILICKREREIWFLVLVSELMLQQTQVATVIRYYETWMKVDKIVCYVWFIEILF
jgi:hypothetical protein